MQKIILIIIFFWLQYVLWFGKNGVYDFYHTKNKIFNLEKKNSNFKLKNKKLEKKIEKLKKIKHKNKK